MEESLRRAAAPVGLAARRPSGGTGSADPADRAAELQTLTPRAAATRLLGLGFLVVSDIPDRPGPAYLLVAVRDEPTRHHFDPDIIDYWTSVGGRGVRAQITRETRRPIDVAFSWGTIRLLDRHGVANDFVTFGGRLRAERIPEGVFASFVSPAPLLRRGGHSQLWDAGADSIASWFGRVLFAVDCLPGFEGEIAGASPVSHYAAFVADTIDRFRRSVLMRDVEPQLWARMLAERRRLCADAPLDWARGQQLRETVRGLTHPAVPAG